MKCTHCGADVNDQQTICLECGQRLSEIKIVEEGEEETTVKKVKRINEDYRTTVAVLAIAFGYVGAHCFYLGEKKKGITRIITLFLPPIGGILWILDIIKIVKGTYTVNPDAFI